MKNIIKRNLIRGRLSQLRGNIISDVVEIESALGWRLRRYFFPKTNNQAAIFYWNIINTSHFSFDKKISLYEQIQYFKNLKSYSKVKSSLRFVQNLRNALAHWWLDETTSNESNIVIVNPATLKRLTINDELMEKFKEHEKFLLKTFGWVDTLKEKYGMK